MLVRCSNCEKEMEQAGRLCQHCGDMTFPVEIQIENGIAYLHADDYFGEWLLNYEDSNLTLEQLKAMHNFMYEVELKFTFDGNKIKSVEVAQ